MNPLAASSSNDDNDTNFITQQKFIPNQDHTQNNSQFQNLGDQNNQSQSSVSNSQTRKNNGKTTTVTIKKKTVKKSQKIKESINPGASVWQGDHFDIENTDPEYIEQHKKDKILKMIKNSHIEKLKNSIFLKEINNAYYEMVRLKEEGDIPESKEMERTLVNLHASVIQSNIEAFSKTKLAKTHANFAHSGGFSLHNSQNMGASFNKTQKFDNQQRLFNTTFTTRKVDKIEEENNEEEEEEEEKRIRRTKKKRKNKQKRYNNNDNEEYNNNNNNINNNNRYINQKNSPQDNNKDNLAQNNDYLNPSPNNPNFQKPGDINNEIQGQQKLGSLSQPYEKNNLDKNIIQYGQNGYHYGQNIYNQDGSQPQYSDGTNPNKKKKQKNPPKEYQDGSNQYSDNNDVPEDYDNVNGEEQKEQEEEKIQPGQYKIIDQQIDVIQSNTTSGQISGNPIDQKIPEQVQQVSFLNNPPNDSNPTNDQVPSGTKIPLNPKDNKDYMNPKTNPYPPYPNQFQPQIQPNQQQPNKIPIYPQGPGQQYPPSEYPNQGYPPYNPQQYPNLPFKPPNYPYLQGQKPGPDFSQPKPTSGKTKKPKRKKTPNYPKPNQQIYPTTYLSQPQYPYPNDPNVVNPRDAQGRSNPRGPGKKKRKPRPQSSQRPKINPNNPYEPYNPYDYGLPYNPQMPQVVDYTYPRFSGGRSPERPGRYMRPKSTSLSRSRSSSRSPNKSRAELLFAYPSKGKCFACDVNCSISRSGNSPNKYVPYMGSFKEPRKDITFYDGEKYGYYQYKSRVQDNN